MHEHIFTDTIKEARIPTSNELVSITFGCECGETIEVTPGSKLYTELKHEHGKREAIKSSAARKRKPSKKQGGS